MRLIKAAGVTLVLFLCVFALFVGLIGCSPATPEVRSAPMVVMDPHAGAPSAIISVYGSGFREGEQVNLTIVNAKIPNYKDSLEMHIGPLAKEVVANASGAWSSADWQAQAAIPASLAPGVYTLEAKGNKGSLATVPVVVLKPKTK